MPPASKPSAAALSVSHCIHFPSCLEKIQEPPQTPLKKREKKAKRVGYIAENPNPHSTSSTPAERRLCLMGPWKGSAIPWAVQRAQQCIGSLAEHSAFEELVMLNRHGCSVGPCV